VKGTVYAGTGDARVEAAGELYGVLELPADAQRMVNAVFYDEGIVATVIHGGRMLAVSVSDADAVYAALYRGGEIMVPPSRHRGDELVAEVLGSEIVRSGCDGAMLRAVEAAYKAQGSA